VGSGTRSVRAVTGDRATSARQEGYRVDEKVAALHADVESFCASNVLLHQVCGRHHTVSCTCYEYVVHAVTLLSVLDHSYAFVAMCLLYAVTLLSVLDHFYPSVDICLLCAVTLLLKLFLPIFCYFF
jgi:hypothetical protein